MKKSALSRKTRLNNTRIIASLLLAGQIKITDGKIMEVKVGEDNRRTERQPFA